MSSGLFQTSTGPCDPTVNKQACWGWYEREYTITADLAVDWFNVNTTVACIELFQYKLIML